MYPNDRIKDAANECGWHIRAIESTNSIARSVRRKHEEWLVFNYDTDERFMQ